MKTTTPKKQDSNTLVIKDKRRANVMPIAAQILWANRKQWDKSRSRAKRNRGAFNVY